MPARLADAADEFLLPLERVRGGGVPGARRAPTGQALVVDGAQVSAVLRDRDGDALGDPAVQPVARAHDRARREWTVVPRTDEVVDLVGQVVGPFAGVGPARPWEIVTLRLG